MLDTLKSEVEGEGENSSHCENTECHCENAFNESSTDAELTSDETSKDLGDAVEKYRPNNDAKTKVSFDEAPLASLLRWLMSHHAAWAMGRMAAAVISSIVGDAASSYKLAPHDEPWAEQDSGTEPLAPLKCPMHKWHGAADAEGSQPRPPQINDAAIGRHQRNVRRCA